MASKNIQRPVFDNPFINIKVNPDGTVNRSPEIRNPPNPDPNTTSPVLSKDVTLDPNKKTWIRIYIPNMTSPPPPSNHKLPLVFYYHGGGFVFCNADTNIYDVFCKGLVEKIGAVVVSLDYRLAPEHRLPAAYEDAVDAFHWITNTKDDWITKYADLSNCFICGTSAGANIAYHAGLKLSAMGTDFDPLKVVGMVLHHPYFSGSKRTESEKKMINDTLLPLYAIDQMFDLSLPEEESGDHDHEFCNPVANGGSKNVEEVKRLGWRVLVTGCFDDPLVDAGLECGDMLEGRGVEVVRFFSDGYHAMEVFDPCMAGPLYDAIKGFIFSFAP